MRRAAGSIATTIRWQRRSWLGSSPNLRGRFCCRWRWACSQGRVRDLAARWWLILSQCPQHASALFVRTWCPITLPSSYRRNQASRRVVVLQAPCTRYIAGTLLTDVRWARRRCRSHLRYRLRSRYIRIRCLRYSVTAQPGCGGGSTVRRGLLYRRQ